MLATVQPAIDAAGAEAARLRTFLFPEGMTFAQADAAAVWSQSRMLRQRIEEEALGAPIDAPVHPSLRRAITVAHEELSAVAGLDGKAPTRGSTRALAEAVSRFSFAVSAYARALSIGLDLEDRAAFDRFVASLTPIDAFRITGRPSDADEDTDAPTPTDTPSPFVSA